MQVWLVCSVAGNRRAVSSGCLLFDGLVDGITVSTIGLVPKSDFLHYLPKPINKARQASCSGR